MEENKNEGVIITLEAQEIRNIYDKLVKYYHFGYFMIADEIQYAINQSPNREYHDCYWIKDNGNLKNNTDNIDYLPDDYPIYFWFSNAKDNAFKALFDKYSFMNEFQEIEIFLLSALHLERLMFKAFGYYTDPEQIEEMENKNPGSTRDIGYFVDCWFEQEKDIDDEKRKLYEFLLDNPHIYKITNLAVAQMEIRYGADSQIKLCNHDNWLYKLIKNALHKELTFGGKFEYRRIKETQKPSNAPSFSNFVAYNTYLLLIEVIGSDKKYPAEFLKFIIDFCELCGVLLLGRHTEVRGMMDFLKHANRQYQGNPIPFSLVRE